MATPPEHGVMRFSVGSLFGLTFARRPVSDLPADGTVCMVDDGDATGWTRRPIPGRYRLGAWTKVNGRPLPFEPTYWIELDRTNGR